MIIMDRVGRLCGVVFLQSWPDRKETLINTNLPSVDQLQNTFFSFMFNRRVGTLHSESHLRALA